MESSQLPLSPTNIDPKHRTWATFCHLSALLGLIGIPLANILGPFVIWLLKRNEIPLVDVEGKEALNFQISMSLYMLLAALLIFVFIGFLLLPLLVIVDLVCIIIASIKTSNGEKFKYPITIRLIK